MPSVRHLNLYRSNSSRRTLTPGITPHAGLCPSGQTGDEDEYGRKRSSSINKKTTRLGSGREEGVLYTVKVAVSIYHTHMIFILLCAQDMSAIFN